MDKHLPNLGNVLLAWTSPKLRNHLSLIALCWINMFYLYWPLKKKSAELYGLKTIALKIQ